MVYVPGACRIRRKARRSALFSLNSLMVTRASAAAGMISVSLQTEMIIPELSTGMKQKDGLSRCPINQSDITALV
jgi:hypothetical protein